MKWGENSITKNRIKKIKTTIQDYAIGPFFARSQHSEAVKLVNNQYEDKDYTFTIFPSLEQKLGFP